MAKKPFDYDSRARELKRLSIIPYDLRKKFSKWEKENIRAKWESYGAYFNAPEKYATPRVGKATAKILRKSGYQVTGKGRAIINKLGNDKVSVNRRKGRIELSKPGEHSTIELRTGEITFLDKLQEMSNLKLTRNQMVTVKIGNSSPFNRQFFSYHELLYYLGSEFEPDGDDIENLWPLMQVVTVTSDKPIKQRLKKRKPKEVAKGTPTRTRTNRRKLK